MKQILFILMLGYAQLAQSQDLPFALFDLAKTQVNPAYVGHFKGIIRTGALYRNQWTGIPLSTGKFSGYQSTAAYLDLPFGAIPIKKRDLKIWFGAGFNFFYDKTSALTKLDARLSWATHLAFGKKQNNILSLGISGAYSSYKTQDLIVANPNGTLSTIPGSEAKSADFSTGLLFSHRGTGWGLEISSALKHLLSFPLAASPDVQLPIFSVNSLIMEVNVGRRSFVRPLLLSQYASGRFYNLAQALYGIKLSAAQKKQAFSLLFGAGTSFASNVLLRAGFEFGGFAFSALYDMSFSKISTHPLHSLEFGLTYIAKLKDSNSENPKTD